MFFALAIPIGLSQQAVSSPAAEIQVRNFYDSGLSLVHRGQIDQAVSEFERALAIAPHDKILLNAVGAAYSFKGDLDTAKTYFARSLDSDPSFSSARQNLGITLFSLGNFAEAEVEFRRMEAQAGPSQSIVKLFLGMIAEKRSDCKTALAKLKDAGALLNQYPDAALASADCAFRASDRKAALEALAAFDRIPSASAAQQERAANLHKSLDQYERTGNLTEAVQSEEKTFALETNRAELPEKSGDFEEAQKIFSNLTRSEPTANNLIDLARVERERGDLAGALRSLKQASEIEPGREDSYLEFSTICSDHGSDALALETANIGLIHVPNSYRLTVQKGVVLEKLGRLGEAEATLRNAVEMKNDDGIAMLSLAVVLAHGGKLDEAGQTLADAIRRFPDNYYMYYFQAKLMLQFSTGASGHEDLKTLAQRSLEKSIKLNPEYADSYYQLSELYNASSLRLAEDVLHKCLNLDPQHIPAQYSLARLYLRTGRKAEGQALFAKLKAQQREEELKQQKQLRIEVAQN